MTQDSLKVIPSTSDFWNAKSLGTNIRAVQYSLKKLFLNRPLFDLKMDRFQNQHVENDIIVVNYVEGKLAPFVAFITTVKCNLR